MVLKFSSTVQVILKLVCLFFICNGCTKLINKLLSVGVCEYFVYNYHLFRIHEDKIKGSNKRFRLSLKWIFAFIHLRERMYHQILNLESNAVNKQSISNTATSQMNTFANMTSYNKRKHSSYLFVLLRFKKHIYLVFLIIFLLTIVSYFHYINSKICFFYNFACFIFTNT